MAPLAYRILVVDDEPDNVEVLRVQLQSDGYTVVAAGDGEEGLAVFDATSPDMVLLDIMLPGRSGFEICRAIKERSGSRFTPVILITALNSDESKVEGFSAGADDFLTKPIGYDILLSRVKYFQELQTSYAPGPASATNEGAFQSYQQPMDELLRELVLRGEPHARVLYRIHSEQKSGFVAVEDEKFIFAENNRIGGREALEEMFLWPATTFEAVPPHAITPNCSVSYGEMLRCWFEKLPTWRLVMEKLPLRQGLLFIDPARANDIRGLRSELQQAAQPFSQGSTVDRLLQDHGGDVTGVLREIAELYYLGYLVTGEKVSVDHLRLPVEAGISATLVSSRFAGMQSQDKDSAFDEGGESPEEVLEALKLELMSLAASTDQLRQENTEYLARLNQQPLAEKAEAAPAKNDAALQKKFAAAEQALAKTQKANLEKTADIAARQRREDTLRDEVASLGFQLSDLKSAAAIAAANERAAKAEHDKLSAQLEEKTKELRAAAAKNSDGGKLQSELDREKAKHALLSKELSEQKVQITALEKKLEEAVKRHEASLREIKLESAAEQKQKLKDFEQVTAAALRDAEDQLRSKENVIRKLQTESDQLKFKAQEFESSKKQFESQISQVKSQLGAAAVEAAQWRDQFLGTVEGNKSEMRKASDHLRQFVETKGKLEAVQANAANAQTQAAKLEKELLAAKQDLLAAKKWTLKAGLAAGAFVIGAVISALGSAILMRGVAAPEGAVATNVAIEQPAAPIKAPPQPAIPVPAVQPAPTHVPAQPAAQAPVATAEVADTRVPASAPSEPKQTVQRNPEATAKPAPEKAPVSGDSKALALAKQGRAAYDAADFPKAIRLFKEAIAINATSTMYSDLGKAFYDSGDAGKAEESYRKALKLSNDNAEAHLGTGMVLAERGDTVNAKKEFKKFLALAPRHPLVDQVKSVLSQLP